MRGTVYTIFVRHCKKINRFERNLEELEKTRYRKKPPGGSRYLTDENDVFLFNAWY